MGNGTVEQVCMTLNMCAIFYIVDVIQHTAGRWHLTVLASRVETNTYLNHLRICSVAVL